jgi:hypothetical protein
VHALGQRPAYGGGNRGKVAGLISDARPVPVQDTGKLGLPVRHRPQQVPAAEIIVNERVARSGNRRNSGELGVCAPAAVAGHQREQHLPDLLAETPPVIRARAGKLPQDLRLRAQLGEPVQQTGQLSDHRLLGPGAANVTDLVAGYPAQRDMADAERTPHMTGGQRNRDGNRQLTGSQHLEQRYRGPERAPGAFVTGKPVGHVPGEHDVVELTVHQTRVTSAPAHDIEIAGQLVIHPGDYSQVPRRRGRHPSAMRASAYCWPRVLLRQRWTCERNYSGLVLDLTSLDLEQVGIALADQNGYEHRWLINPQTGEIAFWTADTGIDGQTPVDLDELDLVCIDPLPSWVWYQDMADFAEAITDERAGSRLLRAIQGKGAFRRFKSELHAEYPHLLTAWYAFRDARAQRRAVQWLADNSLINDDSASRFMTDHPVPDLP